MSEKDGGPAFPTVDANRPADYGTCGMTLRDYFAAQALANLNLQAHVSKPAAENLAKSAYEIADAMLEARKS